MLMDTLPNANEEVLGQRTLKGYSVQVVRANDRVFYRFTPGEVAQRVASQLASMYKLQVESTSTGGFSIDITGANLS
jgi:hypothetical protein